MKKIVIFVVIAMFSIGLMAQPKSLEYNRTYTKVLELNKNRFANLDSIPIGAIVLFPSKDVEGGVEKWVAEQPSNGKYDCIARLTERYIAHKLATTLVNTVVQKKAVVEPVASDNTEKGNSLLLWILVASLGIFSLWIIGIGLWTIRDMIEKRKKLHNPDNYTPVGENLSSMSHGDAVAYMRRFLGPGDSLIRLRRGTLQRNHGPKKITVDMEFGDSIEREMFIYPGEGVTELVIKNGGIQRTELRRTACANGFGGPRFTLPAGWEFVSDPDENVILEVQQPQQLPEIPEPEIRYEDIISDMIKSGNFDVIDIRVPNLDIRIKAKKRKGKK